VRKKKSRTLHGKKRGIIYQKKGVEKRPEQRRKGKNARKGGGVEVPDQKGHHAFEKSANPVCQSKSYWWNISRRAEKWGSKGEPDPEHPND